MSAPYVGLGDSYSAGIGSATPGTQVRRDGGYPVLLARRLGVELDYQAMLGATVPDVLALQVPAVGADTRLVTFTIGGNDAGFASVMIACAQPAWLSDGVAAVHTAMARTAAILPGRLDQLYAAIRDRAPRVQIVVADYPHLFAGVDCEFFTFFTTAEMSAIDQATDDLAGMIAAAAQRHGARTVDVRPPFTGHAWCAPQAWIHGITWPVENSFHPTTPGHVAYADALEPLAAEALAGVAGRQQAARTAPEQVAPAPPATAGAPPIHHGPQVQGSGDKFRLPDLLLPQHLDAAERHGLDPREVADLARHLPRGSRRPDLVAQPPDPAVIGRLRELDAQVRQRLGRP